MDEKLYPVFVSVCIATHIVRTFYEVMKHKNIIEPSKTSFIIIFCNMVLLWTSWFLLCKMDGSAIYFSPVINYFGIFLVVIGVIIFLIALLTIKTLETYDGNLITNGIYSRIRHLMYLSFVLWLIGLPLFYGAVYSYILSIPFIVNILFWRKLEEIELGERFPDYKIYKRRTFF